MTVIKEPSTSSSSSSPSTLPYNLRSQYLHTANVAFGTGVIGSPSGQTPWLQLGQNQEASMEDRIKFTICAIDAALAIAGNSTTVDSLTSSPKQ
mmetsp:Transcript_6096/g.9529  ORF Transcript_6096/g.9529 Transcript_6096/m.9529 type:complete len:94 (-) Transcript_6096:160-441(-)